MSLPVIILGAGGHAKVLVDALKLCSKEIIGILDADPKKKGMSVLGIPVIGNDDAVESYPPKTVRIVNGIGSTSRPVVRRVLFETLKLQGYEFAAVIHPSAVIASDVELAEGVQVLAGAVIQSGSSIGCNTIVNTRAAIDHDCEIGNHVHIAPGATLSGGIRVGDGVHIGTGATIVQGICIGKDTLVAAGAVLIDDTADGSTVMGVPAKSKRG